MEKLINQLLCEQGQSDLESLIKIKRFIKDEGYTGGKILESVNEAIEYVKKGGLM